MGALMPGNGYAVVASSFPLPSTSVGPYSEEICTAEERELLSSCRALGRFETLNKSLPNK